MDIDEPSPLNGPERIEVVEALIRHIEPFLVTNVSSFRKGLLPPSIAIHLRHARDQTPGRATHALVAREFGGAQPSCDALPGVGSVEKEGSLPALWCLPRPLNKRLTWCSLC